MVNSSCSARDCDAAGKLTKGLCQKHYMRLRRTGSPDIVRKARPTGDGRRKHFMYGAWAGMINRCHNPNNSSYGRYGARGIFVCDRWRADFRNFLSDMGERPEGMTLDRIDGDGPYAPDNCRWADPTEQRLNRTADGDNRTREASSSSKKAYWKKWRAEQGSATPDKPFGKRREGMTGFS